MAQVRCTAKAKLHNCNGKGDATGYAISTIAEPKNSIVIIYFRKKFYEPAMAFNKELPKEYSKRMNEVINFILTNLRDDLPLEKLAAIADYSPFHFQRIFKEVTGESPKRFIIRSRLETAAHLLIMHEHKSISEVALEYGFSSPANFARSFKEYFGFSAEEIRNMPTVERHNLFKKTDAQKHLLETDNFFANIPVSNTETTLQITVKRIMELHGIFLNTALDDDVKIQEAFKKIIQSADAYDLLTPASQFIGIIYPHQGLYRTLVTVNTHERVPKNLSTSEISAGKYASCSVTGNIQETFKSIKTVAEIWLPESGYRIANIFGFEILSQNPVSKPYHLIQREIYIPVEPL